MEYLRAGCKANLSLWLTGRLPNGYHTLSSVFVPLNEPHDTLIISKSPNGNGLTVLCARPDVDPLHNTLTHAYRAFAKATGTAPAITVELEKGIPSGAGLGGGSADAGCLLRYLNINASRPLTSEQLSRCALEAGADVPFFLQDGPCLAEGVGERLTPLPDVASALAGWTLLVCCPNISVSTPWAYKTWDTCEHPCKTSSSAGHQPDEALTKELSTGRGLSTNADCDVKAGMPFTVHNDFETVVLPRFPKLSMIKHLLLENGARHAVMSGSGSSIIGLFMPGQGMPSGLISKLSECDTATYINTFA